MAATPQADNLCLQHAVRLGRLDRHVRHTWLAQAERANLAHRAQVQLRSNSPGERGWRLEDDDGRPPAREGVSRDRGYDGEQSQHAELRRQE